MISTDGMNSYTENKDLNKEILLWINNRIISLLERYIKQRRNRARDNCSKILSSLKRWQSVCELRNWTL